LVIDILILKKEKKKDKKIIKSFQRTFLPKNVTGKIDQKTLKLAIF
jgi:N-acetyl-anhydromuramyl-L-alanine amidase AmpD